MSRPSSSEYSEFFEQQVAKLSQTTVSRAEFIGCTRSEIEECIRAQGVTKLPAVYIAFLGRLGKGAGAFLHSLDVFSTYPDLLEAKQFAIDCLTLHGNPAVISESVFVFSHYLNHYFAYFDTSDGDDPPVFQISEVAAEPTRLADTYSERFANMVDGYIDAVRGR